MSTFLQRLFRPKWQHVDPSIRIQAIQKLNSSNPQDLEIILSLGTEDPSDKVKTAALSLIDDIKTLAQLTSKQAPDQNPALQKRLNEIIQGAPGNLIDCLDQTEQVNLIPWLESPEIVEQVISAIADESILADLAISAKSSRLRQIAVSQIERQDTLKKIQSSIKGKDKTVSHIVRDKLYTIREAADKKAAEEKSLDELERQLKHIACSGVNRLTEPKFKALLTKWQKLEPLASRNKSESVYRAIETAKHRIEEFTIKQTQQQEQEVAMREQQATLLTLEETKNQIDTIQDIDTGRLAALDAVLKTQETRWLEAAQNVPVDKQEQKRYQSLMTDIRCYLSASNQLASYQEEICNLLATNKQKEADAKAASHRLKSILKEINWPEQFQEVSLLKRINDYLGIISEIRLQKAEDIKATRHHIESRLTDLEVEIEEKNLKKSRSLQREIQKQINQLPQKVAQEYAARFSLLHNQIKELEDWHGFATTPKQISLCEKMEELAEKPLDPQYKAEKIKSLQDQWKRFGGTSDQALWQRFKTASDNAFEPCKRFFNEQNELKKVNLEKRLNICNELKLFVDSIDWDNADWKMLDKISKTARQEWRDAFPIDFKQNKKLQRNFNHLLLEIDTKLNQEKADNRKKKEEILKKAEALAQQDSIQDAVNGAKQLQREWSSVGITEFSDDRRLWKAFRGYCDAIFALREKQSETSKREAEEAVSAADQIIEKAEMIVNTLPGESPLGKFDKLTKELGTLNLDSKSKSRYLRTIEHYEQEAKNKLAAQLISNYKTLWKSAIEVALTALQEQPADTYQDDLDHIDQASRRIVEAANVKATLQALIDKQSLPPATTTFLSTDSQDACILIEIATENESPAHLQGRRMELQVARLNAGLKGDNNIGNNNSTGKLQEITQLCVNWMHHAATERADKEAIADQAQRLAKAFASYELD